MAPTSEGKPISSRNICSQHGKWVPSWGGWEQMEQESFSSSCHRPTASEVHHPSPCFPLLLLRSSRGAGGGKKHFNCSLQQGYPSLNPVPEATLLLARHFSISRMPAEPQSAWEERSASPTSGKVRTVSASGGGRRRGWAEPGKGKVRGLWSKIKIKVEKWEELNAKIC